MLSEWNKIRNTSVKFHFHICGSGDSGIRKTTKEVNHALGFIIMGIRKQY